MKTKNTSLAPRSSLLTPRRTLVPRTTYLVPRTLAFLLLALLTACHDELGQDGNSGATINLRSEINQLYLTRANDSGFADGDQIGVFIVNYENGAAPALKPSGNHADNVQFTYHEAEGKWTGSYQLYWKDKTTPVDAYAYYPFDPEMNSVTDYPFTIQHNQSVNLNTGRKLSGYEASDFLWAKKENVVPTAAAITLSHHHIMAGVKVILTEGEGFLDGEWNEISKTVLVENTITETQINLQNGKVTPIANGNRHSIIPEEGNNHYRAVVAPQTVAAGATLFSITADGHSFQFKRDEQMVYYPGKLHQFTFNVQKQLETGDFIFTLISESITPWENDPLSHNGTAREYITVHVNEGQYLGDVIQSMNIDPAEIVNLKLTGVISGGQSFDYIRQNMPYLEAINLKELRTKGQLTLEQWDGGEEWGRRYAVSSYNDDFLPKNAFGHMYYLSYIVFPDSLKGIADGAFNSTNLRGSLILPEGLEYIGGSLFTGTSGFYDEQTLALSGELYIPSTVQFIRGGAFRGTALSGEVILPEHMKYLGDGAFADCEFLTGRIQVPQGLDELNAAFAPNMTAKVVNIPQGVKRVNGIGGQPAAIVFPEGVTEINSLFGGSSQPWAPLSGIRKALRSVKLPSTLRKLGEWAFAGTNISHVNLPEGVEVIPYYAFGQCILQDTLTIPSTVRQIHDMAFYANGLLEAVVLPEQLEEIREFAFAGCSSLYTIRSLNPEPPVISERAFDGVEKNECQLLVPEGSVNAYRQAQGWKEFKRITTYNNFVCRPMQAKLLNKSNTRTVVLNCEGNWKVTHCPSWIHPSKTSGYKKTELTVRIDALTRGSSNRRDSIVFTMTGKVDDDGNPITCYYSVQQFDYGHDEDTQTQLQKATKGRGVNVVFVGDGYDAEDIADGSYLQDINEGMEYFFSIEPYKTYQQYFNVYADMAMSYESGVLESAQIWRDSKFKTTYGAGAGGRLLIHDDEVIRYVLEDVTNSSVNSSNVDQTLIICVLNSDVYEGITAVYSTGAAVAFVPHSRYSYPNDYRGLIQHEAGGHGFGKLGDEYVYHRDNILTCHCICCAHADHVRESKALGWYRNLALDGKYSSIDWHHLIFDSRYSDIVDIYEGGYMHGQGIYRSEVNSCMNNNIPYYSTISRQAIVERIMNYAGENFNFETFVSKDSREMGDKFLTRSGMAGKMSSPSSMYGRTPVVRKGSPLDYIKKLKRKGRN